MLGNFNSQLLIFNLRSGFIQKHIQRRQGNLDYLPYAMSNLDCRSVQCIEFIGIQQRRPLGTNQSPLSILGCRHLVCLSNTQSTLPMVYTHQYDTSTHICDIVDMGYVYGKN